MKITVDLDELKSDDDTWSESTVKAVETVTGQKFPDVVEGAKESAKVDPPNTPLLALFIVIGLGVGGNIHL